jgi:hypothetical protein
VRRNYRKSNTKTLLKGLLLLFVFFSFNKIFSFAQPSSAAIAPLLASLDLHNGSMIF